MSHTIGKCERFKALLQKMMDHGEIEFFEKIMKGSINMITDAKFIRESSEQRPRPLTIFFKDNTVPMVNENVHPSKLIVEVPSPFPYMNSKMVPWNYHSNYVNEVVTANISDIRGMTRSRRCYVATAVEMLPLNPTKELSKSKKFDTSLDLINESIFKK